jgi:murein DD-endopeptidase MepM/ murein hydrolase activator NlpD
VSRTASFSKRGVAALLFAWCLALTQGLPAYAGDGTDQETAVGAPQTGESQSVNVADGPATPVTRDEFSITAPPPPPPPPPAPKLQVSPAKKFGSAKQSGIVNIPTSAVQWPFASSPVSSGFGSRSAPCRGCSSEHKGVDFTPGAGTPIGAIADGVVRTVSSSGGFGTHVIIDHNIDGQAVSSTYAHMQAGSVPLNEGDTVSVGATVGRVGSTGASTGAHLHLEVHVNKTPVDPFAFLTANVT